MKHQHRERIENHVGDAADELHAHGCAGVARRADNAGVHVIEHERHHAQQIQPHIRDRIGHDLLRRLHPAEDHAGKRDAEHGERAADDETHRDAGMYRASDPGAVSRADGLRHHDAHADGEPREEADDAGDDERARADGGGGLLTERAGKEQVHRVIQLLNEAGREQRQREQQELLPNHPLGEILSLHRAAKWQAARWPGESSRSAGASALQRSQAFGQRWA